MRIASALLSRVDGSRRWLWFAVFVPLAVLYTSTLRTNIGDMSADPVAVPPSAWAVARHGTPVLPQSLWPHGNPWWLQVGHDLVVTNRTPGLVYLAAPVYWLIPGSSTTDERPASLVAAFVTAAAMATLALVLAKIVAPRLALGAALVAGAATTTWAVSGTALWPHGPDQLALALSMLALAGGYYARTGFAYAFGILFRPLLAVATAGTALVEAWRVRRLRPVLAIGGIAALGLAGYAGYVQHYWHSTGSNSRTVVNTATHGYTHSLLDIGPSVWPGYLEKIAGALVSPGRGVLIGSAFLLALLPGLRAGWRVAPGWARSCAVGAGLYMLVQLKGEVFTGGMYFWSYRYPLEPLTLSAPLLVLAWREWTGRTRRRRAAFGALLIFSVAWQAIGAICFRGPYPDRPWQFVNLADALTGSRAVMAWLLFAGGLIGAATYYLRNRGSGRSDVLDVAGADRLLAA